MPGFVRSNRATWAANCVFAASVLPGISDATLIDTVFAVDLDRGGRCTDRGQFGHRDGREQRRNFIVLFLSSIEWVVVSHCARGARRSAGRDSQTVVSCICTSFEVVAREQQLCAYR